MESNPLLDNTLNENFNIDAVIIRRIRPEDGNALVEFYNGLSESSKRTFRPIDYKTTLDVC